MGTQELQLAILYDLTYRLGDVGKIRLQKLAYFLQEAFAVPTKFPFKMHHYGPYSETIETNTARLKLAGYVDVAADAQGYGFHITPTDEAQGEWRDLVKPFKDSIEGVINNFGQRAIPELELAATIHYVKRLRPEVSTSELVGTVGQLKPKFDQKYVSQVASQLEEIGILT
ncbi:MAG: hypothetical protein J4G01_01650 [Dehalococcoidia bacterium]|nr:hypothetical protein [Dehalococcoidia bacterium]